jgi:hypothetical protein
VSRSRTLAFDWLGFGIAPNDGVWLLNTRTATGGLLAHSRLTVAAHGKVWDFTDGGVLTADGSTIVAPMWKPSAPPPGVGESEEFSAATGTPVRVLDRTPYVADLVEWTNSTGSVLVVRDQAMTSGPEVTGVVSGKSFVKLPGAPAVAEVTF